MRPLVLSLLACLLLVTSAIAQDAEQGPTLLTDPFLQLPTEDGVRVVWLTEFCGVAHRVGGSHVLVNTCGPIDPERVVAAAKQSLTHDAATKRLPADLRRQRPGPADVDPATDALDNERIGSGGGDRRLIPPRLR
jgi:hypothetical protein